MPSTAALAKIVAVTILIPPRAMKLMRKLSQRLQRYRPFSKNLPQYLVTSPRYSFLHYCSAVTTHPALITRWLSGFCQSLADGGESAPAFAAAGFDNGAEGRVGFGAPLGAEPVGDFAEDHRRPQRPLAFVVGRLGVAALQEHEELVAAVESHRIAKLAALRIGRLAREQ